MKKIIILLSALLALPALAGWQYDESADKMTGKKTTTAVIESNNSLALGFPYKGQNNGRIFVRRHPSYGLDVFVTVQKGQILCRSYDGCNIAVRFDDGQPVKFSGKSAADYDSTVVFLGNTSRFIEAAKKAKKIFVQLTMYQAGAPVLEFYADKPLLWETPKITRPTPSKKATPQPKKAESETVWPTPGQLY